MAEPPRRPRRRLHAAGAALLALAMTFGGSACGSDRPSGDECDTDAACAGSLGCENWPACDTSDPATGAPVDLQLRPVLAAEPPPEPDLPCPTLTEATAPDAVVVVPECIDGVIELNYRLGPMELDGSAFESARAVESQAAGGWVVNPVLKQGREGLDGFNAATARCFAREASCPTGQLAIVVDGIVVTAPTIQAPSFEADQIQIMGSPFTEAPATELAARIDAAG